MNTAVAAPWAAPGRRLALGLLAAVAAYLGLTLWFGGADTADAASRIGAGWLLAGMALTTANFAVRATRWHFLLRTLGHHVPPAVDGAVYLAGIGLSATPGKAGETVRSAFLVRHGVPVGSSLAAFLADRLSDVHAVLLIALLPLAWAAGWNDAAALRWLLVLGAVAAAPLAVSAFVHGRHWRRFVAAAARLKALRRPAEWMRTGADDFVRLWRPGVASWSVAASLLAYALQAATFAGMVAQLGLQVPWHVCFAIFGAATLAGAASLLPGGLGAMELALVLMLRQQGADGASALAAALCLRAVTFWFGLLLGAAGLAVASRLQRA
ncbi:flippase-like domain-containing protein [Ramlibacter sp. USB13]|uniref:Flippase-like domain-containing protein n=1 Tax=Ramlibacter cellulosilyticus TaxID=2764187 RepID=A0A923MPL6_9BURK|nr:lysylphosphatidylglycerol synthase transmembrane domain-containing protein [Ramlibacter cellulosilyticus]MBC5782880.1 flippase-like domain-containing protein [Ramlibacter cellulosilyticus]